MSLLSKLGRRGSDAPRRTAGIQQAPLPLRPTQDTIQGASALKIACPDPTSEDRARDSHRNRGQFLARQDMWDTLSAEVSQADQSCAATPAGMPIAELLCFGARADVVAAAEHALIDGAPPKDAPLMAGIEGLEEMLSEHPDNAICAITVAHAHMDIGWAWRGTDWSAQVPARNLEAFEAHFDRARDILHPFDQSHTRSPLYQTACCALNGAGIVTGPDISRSYEKLIDLNPLNPGPMRALGNYLQPRWFGSHAELELEARRTAARTHAQWGAGGYTWVMFDVLASDAEACLQLDVGFFIEGLQDILDRFGDQHTTNILAAFCSYTLGGHRTGNPKADAVRVRIADCAHWIVRKHMTELHPLIWAHAASGFDNSLHVPSPRRFAAAGRHYALRVIAMLFRREIADGRRIVFTADGPVTEVS
ncbi:MAG: hypothetical protein AB8B47_00045 [Roseobacter sp.]